MGERENPKAGKFESQVAFKDAEFGTQSVTRKPPKRHGASEPPNKGSRSFGERREGCASWLSINGTYVAWDFCAKSSSREVRIRVPFFLCSLF